LYSLHTLQANGLSGFALTGLPVVGDLEEIRPGGRKSGLSHMTFMSERALNKLGHHAK